tara:strand:+ start:3186 stop:4241 length:1056 start_codon:yes stop_codon:yes gene_type:complete
MAYQNIGTPRFYVDHLLWLKTLGEDYYTDAMGGFIDITDRANLIGLNPVRPHKIAYGDQLYTSVYMTYSSAADISNSNGSWKAYTAVLGHNAQSAGAKLRFVGAIADEGEYWVIEPHKYINYTPYNPPYYDGFTLCYDFNSRGDDIIVGLDPNYEDTYNTDFNINCISHGNYYDMPSSPDLSLAMSREYGGAKKTTTQNGSSISNQMWYKPPMWGDLAAWELYSSTAYFQPQQLSRSGRRTWDLNFSYIEDKDMFPMLSSIEPYGSTSADGDPYSSGDTWHINQTILDSDNFFSQVWHKTLGGTLPFIFQPDKDNNNPDQFAICRFKDSSLKVVQSAFHVYDISLKIEEVW